MEPMCPAASLVSGPSTNLTVSYTGLPVNSVLSGTVPLNAANISINIVDNGGIVTTNNITYDSFSPTNFTWEAEDYDLNGGGVSLITRGIAFSASSGHLIGKHPVPRALTTTTTATARRGFTAARLIWWRRNSAWAPGVNGGNSVGELMRQKIVDAFALDPTVRDVDMGFFDGPGTGAGLPNWVNYTRTYPSGPFNVYARAAFGGTGGAATLSQVTNGWGTGSQGTLLLGTFNLPNSGGWESYYWVPLRDSSGNLVRLNLNGSTNTFQLTAGAGGGGNQNFLMLSPANTNVPVISAIYPNGTNLMQFSTNLSFIASSPIGVAIGTNSISVLLHAEPIF